MSRQRLQDAQYRTLGYIDTDSSGKQTGKSARYTTVGYYDPITNRTTDANFRLVAYGNTLSTLINQNQ